MSRKGPSELSLSGSFPGCSQAPSPCSLLLSRMLNARQPLISSLSIWWKGWLPLRCSRILVIRLVPPAAWACQQRSRRKRSSRTKFSASSRSACKIPQSESLLSLSRLQRQAGGHGTCERGGRRKMGKIFPLPKQQGKAERRRDANPQPRGPKGHGLTARSESRHSAARATGAKSVGSMEMCPLLRSGEQDGSVLHTGPALFTSRGAPRAAEGWALLARAASPQHG